MRAAVVVAPWAQPPTRLRRAVQAVVRGESSVRLVSSRECRRPATGIEGFRTGDGQLCQPDTWAAVMAQGRAARGLPDRGCQARPFPQAQPQDCRTMDTQGGLGTASTVPCHPPRSEVVPGDLRPGGPVARRVGCYPTNDRRSWHGRHSRCGPRGGGFSSIENADVNAARNIAAGHAATARGGLRSAGPTNREPPVPPPANIGGKPGIPAAGREDVKSFRR